MTHYQKICKILNENVDLYPKKCVTKTPQELKKYFSNLHFSALQNYHQEKSSEEKQVLFRAAMLYKNLFNDAERKSRSLPNRPIQVCWKNPQLKPIMSRIDEVQNPQNVAEKE